MHGSTLRGLYGLGSKVFNAVHCTDLEDEGVLECEFFFVLMDSKKSRRTSEFKERKWY